MLCNETSGWQLWQHDPNRLIEGVEMPQQVRGVIAKAKGELVDPLQWWGSIAQQFQQIATNAVKDATRQSAIDTTRNMAKGLAREALRTAGGAMSNTKPSASKKRATSKDATRASGRSASKAPRKVARKAT